MLVVSSKNPACLPEQLGKVKAVVTIGNFDGCHLGHQALIAQTIKAARRHNAQAIVVSFDPRPDVYFSKQQRRTIFTNHQKKRALAELGVDIYFEISFDHTIAHMSAKDFYQSYLRDLLQTREIFVGPNFFFGHKREGNPSMLKALCHNDNIACVICAPADSDGTMVSSSRIRRKLSEQGNVAAITSMLGRPFALEGTVIPGQQKGREIGFPTANLSIDDQVLPANGVYAGHAVIWTETPPSILSIPQNTQLTAINIGTAPTIDSSEDRIKVECHMINAQYQLSELYGKNLTIYLEKFVRAEKTFTNLEQLQAAIAADISMISNGQLGQ